MKDKQYSPQELNDIMIDLTVPWETKQELKKHLPKKKLSETDNSRDWKVGDILADGEMNHFLIIEG